MERNTDFLVKRFVSYLDATVPNIDVQAAAQLIEYAKLLIEESFLNGCLDTHNKWGCILENNYKEKAPGK